MLRLAGERNSWHEAHFACHSGRFVSSTLLPPGSTLPVTPPPATSTLCAPERLAPRTSTSTVSPTRPPMGNSVLMRGIWARQAATLSNHRHNTPSARAERLMQGRGLLALLQRRRRGAACCALRLRGLKP